MKTAALLNACADPLVLDNEGYSALSRAMARLCADAADYERAFDELYEALRRAVGESRRPGASGGALVGEVIPAARECVERMAARIPMTDTSEFGPRWRRELVETVAVLAAYEVWARAERGLG